MAHSWIDMGKGHDTSKYSASNICQGTLLCQRCLKQAKYRQELDGTPIKIIKYFDEMGRRISKTEGVICKADTETFEEKKEGEIDWMVCPECGITFSPLCVIFAGMLDKERNAVKCPNRECEHEMKFDHEFVFKIVNSLHRRIQSGKLEKKEREYEEFELIRISQIFAKRVYFYLRKQDGDEQ